eukprot:CAMPEP_0116032118 /NCGR_PEP_ID=MMETSP0321-20121206/17975_1 /TAXON_ID=163516 /ORGANISM="Leptocylindrus danicus var. danicus, Strain B650" /LENGTH=420 /DNA_ID=CAMNT_0003507485 /DNA_START=183 /DNA_END=1445 /DNA_ORIENTATION=+
MFLQEGRYYKSGNNNNHSVYCTLSHPLLNTTTDGNRWTTFGEDRLKKVLIPTLQATIESITQNTDWHVDVYLILGFTLSDERRQLIVDALPDRVGLEIWNDACPLYYDKGNNEELVVNTRALARQHRFVIKDKLEYYDLFSCWEDDMKITSDHMQNFLQITNELNDLRSKAPEIRSEGDNSINGMLSTGQLLNAIPGFIRVEVLKEGAISQPELSMDPIEVDNSVRVNGEACCNGAHSEDLVLWETGIAALGVREFPGNELGWMAILPGSHARQENKISTYWSGEDGAYGNMRRPGGEGKYFANPGGIIVTREQIEHIDQVCKDLKDGTYLPPFSGKFWHGNSGLKPHNVEFWSGGYQVFGQCGMQRLLSLDSKTLSKQLLHHTSDNKQRQITKNRLVKADHLLGQLQTVKQAAEKKLRM